MFSNISVKDRQENFGKTNMIKNKKTVILKRLKKFPG